MRGFQLTEDQRAPATSTMRLLVSRLGPSSRRIRRLASRIALRVASARDWTALRRRAGDWLLMDSFEPIRRWLDYPVSRISRRIAALRKRE